MAKKTLAERPEFNVDIWNAFAVLSAQRDGGFSGITPIPVSEVMAYCDLRGMTDPDTRTLYLRGVTALDQEWREKHGTSGT